MNGEQVGKSPYVNDRVIPGSYLFKVHIDTYDDYIENIFIVKNKQLQKSVTLTHTKFYLDSLHVAEELRHSRSRWVRRISFAVIAVGAASAGTYFAARSDNEYDHYMQYKGYESSVHKENWEDVGKAQGRMVAMFILAGVSAIGLAISVPF